jgi:hypothetical protein
LSRDGKLQIRAKHPGSETLLSRLTDLWCVECLLDNGERRGESLEAADGKPGAARHELKEGALLLLAVRRHDLNIKKQVSAQINKQGYCDEKIKGVCIRSLKIFSF